MPSARASGTPAGTVGGNGMWVWIKYGVAMAAVVCSNMAAVWGGCLGLGGAGNMYGCRADCGLRMRLDD